MISNLIFSFDRSCQLDLLLRSIDINAKSVFNINVLYKHSNDDFKKGYDILKERFPNVNFIEETNFREQVLKFLENDSEYVCFAVDDDIVYLPVKEEDALECMKNEDVLCFSCRLGKNVSFCYTMNSNNILIPLKEDDKFVWWEWEKHYLDFSYPYSLDFHVFRLKQIKKMIKAIQFNSPNTFEGNLQTFSFGPGEQMVAYKHSVVVNSPNNIVNTTHPNRKGEKFAFSAKELNERYLNNEIIDYEKLDFSGINAAHVELNYQFKKI